MRDMAGNATDGSGGPGPPAVVDERHIAGSGSFGIERSQWKVRGVKRHFRGAIGAMTGSAARVGAQGEGPGAFRGVAGSFVDGMARGASLRLCAIRRVRQLTMWVQFDQRDIGVTAYANLMNRGTGRGAQHGAGTLFPSRVRVVTARTGQVETGNVSLGGQ